MLKNQAVGANGLAIQIKSFLTDKADEDTHVQSPDAIIHNLMQVVGLVVQEDEPPPLR
jgi:hypothetical protein